MIRDHLIIKKLCKVLRTSARFVFKKCLPHEAPFYLARTLAILNNTKIIKFLSAAVERFSLSTN